ncbi:hypothetical protein THAOC_23618, partial [Thalassiosira oceanica]
MYLHRSSCKTTETTENNDNLGPRPAGRRQASASARLPSLTFPDFPDDDGAPPSWLAELADPAMMPGRSTGAKPKHKHPPISVHSVFFWGRGSSLCRLPRPSCRPDLPAFPNKGHVGTSRSQQNDRAARTRDSSMPQIPSSPTPQSAGAPRRGQAGRLCAVPAHSLPSIRTKSRICARMPCREPPPGPPCNLAVVPDDASHGTASHPHRAPINGADATSSAVVMTSRRLAFVMQGLAHCCAKWSEHGASVGVRVHSAASPLLKGARTPDHLSLASRASVVVCDEPFVSPYSTLVQRVEQACLKSQVECLRVDGSCTVPPVSVLRRRNSYNVNGLNFDGLPAKAYQWQSKTEHLRQGHLNAAMEGHFDAPELLVKMEDEDLFSHACPLAHLFPARWKATSDDGSNS